ncbi:diguanylate cyclase [Alteromonas sp. AMM-1]|uniref:tetratricopeptide repeat-containing diguanylate cyclase n=1 Tax=Alteromonas sp. AMM-1 TaxID=3394233 RepID=UPI0039A61B88
MSHLLSEIGLTYVAIACLTLSANAIEFDDELASLRADINQSPTAVIKQITSLLEQGRLPSEQIEAQYRYVLSEAYYAAILGGQALEQSLLVVSLAEKAKDTQLLQWANAQVCVSYEMQGDAEAGITYGLKALEWAQQNNDEALLANSRLSLGSAYITLAQFDKALTVLQDAYLQAQRDPVGTKMDPAHVASFIALVYEYKHAPALTIPYFIESVDYYRQTQNQVELSNSLFGLGKAYLDLKQPETALDYFNESMAISLSLGDKQGEAYTAVELVRLHMDNPQVASKSDTELLDSLNNVLSVFESSQNRYMQFSTNIMILRLLERQHRLEEALVVAERARQLAVNESMLNQRYDALIKKSDILAGLGRFEQAYQVLYDAHKAYESYIKQTNAERYQQSRAEFQLEQAELNNQVLAEKNARQTAELTVASREKTIVWLVVAVLAIAFIAILLVLWLVRGQRDYMSKLAHTDELTGVFNRRQTLALLSREHKLALRSQKALPVAVADLDNFKLINDKLGHHVGDMVLKFVADKARASLRSTDIFGRIGGEEFLIILPDTTVDNAQVAIGKLLQACEALPKELLQLGCSKVTFSVGLVDGAAFADEHLVLIEADKQMYQAKAAGKARIQRG